MAMDAAAAAMDAAAASPPGAAAPAAAAAPAPPPASASVAASAPSSPSSPSSRYELPQRQRLSKRAIQQLFNILDADHDGFISPTDLEAVRPWLYESTVSPSRRFDAPGAGDRARGDDLRQWGLRRSIDPVVNDHADTVSAAAALPASGWLSQGAARVAAWWSSASPSSLSSSPPPLTPKNDSVRHRRPPSDDASELFPSSSPSPSPSSSPPPRLPSIAALASAWPAPCRKVVGTFGGIIDLSDADDPRTKQRAQDHFASKWTHELLAACDANRDGRISFEEFRGFIEMKERELYTLFQSLTGPCADTSRAEPSSGPSPPPGGAPVPETDFESLSSALLSASNPATRQSIPAFLRTLDPDRHGRVSFASWRDSLLLMPQQASLDAIMHFYSHLHATQFDINSDTVLTSPDWLPSLGHQVRQFAAGGLAGAVSRTCTAPLDRIRVYLITQHMHLSAVSAVASSAAAASAAATKPYQAPKRHIVTAAREIMQLHPSNPITTFFRGNGVNVVKVVPESAIKFYVFEAAKRSLPHVQLFQSSTTARQRNGDPGKAELNAAGRFVAGGISGFVSQFAIYPLDTFKTRLMAEQAPPPSSSMSTPRPPAAPSASRSSVSAGTLVWRQMRAEGPRSFYRGLIPSLCGIIPYAGTDLAVFETLKVTLVRRQRERLGDPEAKVTLPVPYVLAMGMASGCAGGMVVYPLNVVRTRMQAWRTAAPPAAAAGAPAAVAATPPTPTLRRPGWLPLKSPSIGETIRAIWRVEGLRGFYTGLQANLLKVLPSAALSYVVYERAKIALDV